MVAIAGNHLPIDKIFVVNLCHREGQFPIPDEGDVIGLSGVGIVEVSELHAREALHLPLQVGLGLRHGHVAVGVHITGRRRSEN